MRRRALLAALSAAFGAAATPVPSVRRGRVLHFPRDHGAHPDASIEWWYATGWLGRFEAPAFGFQLTFFRRRTGLAADNPSRFAARQLLFVHAALTDLGRRQHHQAQRIARWSGAADAAARASAVGTDLHVGHWQLADTGDAYLARLSADDFALDLRLARAQPLLLQGEAGFSRKGPQPSQASHYVSEPQLRAEGRVTLAGRTQMLGGRAWLDHEWSDELLHRDAVGWDWIGINLADGSALTAFRLRRADGSALWAGGSWRPGHAAGAAPRAFAPDAVRFAPGRVWVSPATNARYPVEWQVDTPVGRFEVAALLDAQELDSRASVGTAYWEGLSELRDAAGQRVGLGYLEMTGYAGSLRL